MKTRFLQMHFNLLLDPHQCKDTTGLQCWCSESMACHLGHIPYLFLTVKVTNPNHSIVHPHPLGQARSALPPPTTLTTCNFSAPKVKLCVRPGFKFPNSTPSPSYLFNSLSLNWFEKLCNFLFLGCGW